MIPVEPPIGENNQDIPHFVSKSVKYASYFQLVILCCSALTHSSMVTGAVSVSMSSIEKAFKLSNIYVVMVLTVYNIFLGLASIPVSYLAKNNKQFFLNLGMLSISIGGCIFILPVFLKSQPKMANILVRTYLCGENVSSRPVTESHYQALYVVIMYIGYAVIGVGSVPLFTTAIRYIIETFEKSKSPLLISIYFLCQVMGTMLVFLSSKLILRVPLHPWIKRDPHEVPDQDKWVGAYWLIYLIGSIVLLLLMLLNICVNQFIKKHSRVKTISVLSFKN
ncbi:Solute carrier organic anion transporter family member 4A1 [Thelohanellus kitauei]|uniref:Solute carrier organic anion transporter family member 4A1 n=1 Tax=Thelohanellus kitauei TaxID=669202 RepID=A0A0C2M7Y2_THEKT|nr:Solute carrier organic anion transporter family member 4A1 [Thelohanellus kitauei]